MKFVNTLKGRMSCPRNGFNHLNTQGIAEPCAACRPAPRRMEEKEAKRRKK